MPGYSYGRSRERQELVARLMMMDDDELTAWCDARRDDDWPVWRTSPDPHTHGPACEGAEDDDEAGDLA